MLHLFLAGCLVFSSAFAADAVPETSRVAAVDHSAEWDVYLREQRAEEIERLRTYAAAGVFPLNLDRDGFKHQFLDAAGSPCAVAYLIQESGGGSLARQTAMTDNEVVVADVTSGPLADWFLSSGLIREEVAVIQKPARRVSYESKTPVDSLVVAEQARMRERLAAVIDVLEQDTESSMWKAKLRLGDRLNSAPPGDSQTLTATQSQEL